MYNLHVQACHLSQKNYYKKVSLSMTEHSQYTVSIKFSDSDFLFTYVYVWLTTDLCLSLSLRLSVWSWTLSSRRTSYSRWWGGCAHWRTRLSPRCLTLRRHTPPRPNARPKPRPRNTHAGNCGFFDHTELQDTRSRFHTVTFVVFLLPFPVSFYLFIIILSAHKN